MYTKVKDGMFGLAIADAIGVPAEFKHRSELRIHPVTDMVGYGTHNQPPGTWSDDSAMAIATLDSINEKNTIDYTDIMYKFSLWLKESKYTATGDFFDIGITTSNAIHNYLNGVNPIQCGEKSVYSNGNGSLMRILPVVLYCYYKKISNDEEVEMINNASSLTHAHEISKLGCKIYSDYIKNILNRESKEEAYDHLNREDYKDYYSEESINYYKRLFDGSLKTAQEEDIKSTGFVVDSLEASIWTNLMTDNYRDAVIKSVNLGDDTDTVGAITGSIAGILYGYESIPEHWRKGLISKEFLEDLCNKFDDQIGR